MNSYDYQPLLNDLVQLRGVYTNATAIRPTIPHKYKVVDPSLDENFNIVFEYDSGITMVDTSNQILDQIVSISPMSLLNPTF